MRTRFQSPGRVAAAIASASLLLGACQTIPQFPTPALPGYQPRPPSPELTIVDTRPDADKISTTGSPWITSCDFGINHVGDDITAPPRMELLRRDLEDALGPRLHHATLTVSRYRIFLNQLQIMRGVATSGTPPLGAAIGMAILTPGGCTEGVYRADEVTNGNSPYVAELSAEFDGHAYTVRTVYSVPVQILQSLKEPAAGAALFATMQKTDAALIAQLAAALPTTAASP